MFSTDLKSSRLTCNATVANNHTLECDAPLWFNNTVDPQVSKWNEVSPCDATLLMVQTLHLFSYVSMP